MIWESFWVLFDSFWLPFGSFWQLFEGLGGVLELNGKRDAFGGETSGMLGSLLGSILGTFSALLFSGLRDTKKGGPGGPSKLNLFFGRF